MNFRFTWVLFAAVAALAAALLVSVWLDDAPHADEILLANLAGAKAEDIDAVELLRTEPAEEKLVFARTGPNRWELREPFAARVDGLAVESLVGDLLKLKPTTYPELSSNAAVHGLDQPSVKVTLRRGSGTTATLNVGDTTLGADRAVTFVTTAARPGVPVAVRRSDLGALFRLGTKDGKAWQIAKWLPDYRQRRLLAGDVSDPVTGLQTVKLKQGAKEVVLTRTESGEWRFAAPAGYGKADVAGAPEATPDTYTGVRPLLGILSQLQAFDAEDFIESPDPLEKYGLKPDDPGVIRIEIQPKAGPAEVLYVGKKVDEKATPVKYFAKLDGDRAVVRVQTDRVPALAKVIADPSDLRDRTLVSDAKKEAIDAIDITTGGATTKLRRVSQNGVRQWVLYGGPGDPQVAGPSAQQLVDALTKPRAAREVLAAANDAAFAPSEVKAEVKLWFDGTEAPPPGPPDKLPPEPKLKGDGKPAVTLVFGKAEGDATFARRTTDGTTADLKVPLGLAATAAQSRLAFVSLALKGFATNDVTRVAFNRGAEPFELTKDDKPDANYPTGKWVFAKPDRLKGQVADADRVANDLLTNLRNQSAMKAVAEQPSEADLKRYGLDPAGPRLKVTLALAGPDKEVVYEFGNPAEDDKATSYAKQSGRPLVFTVPEFIPKNFEAVDLRDRTLYRVDPAQVQRVRVHGYKQALGTLAEYVFERKGAEWVTAKSPLPLTADTAKVNALVSAFASPRAEAFVPGGLKPEHGFDGSKDPNPMRVELELADGKAVALTVGNEADAGLTYFASPSSMPGEVVTVSAAPLRAFKDRPTSLGK